MKHPDRRHAFIGGAAVLMVVIIALPARRSHSALVLPAPAHPSASVAGDGSAAADAQLLLKQRERKEQASWARDPFSAAPLGTPARFVEARAPVDTARSPVPTLRGISLCGEDGLAVIDREIVHTGDRLASGYVVGKITARSVTLTRDQEELVLTLGDQP